ncbi:MAG TPA: shikimate dehydrogenase [Plantibacter sp.]|uniref:shikimate dehydrogenase n=1 Tax=unclassified Plantibacter TaxID=2624265 RepID=UPI002CE63FE6|nr:shikimate dehydrogenase [Plantibacter sp.]
MNASEQPQHLAVLGDPIEHSKSPALHAAAYGALGLDWEYDRRRVDANGLDGLLAGLGPTWRGLSLTMPLKQRALELADELDRTAVETRAVNTLRLQYAQDGSRRLHGFNTDVGGIVRAVGAAGLPVVEHVVILGGGATAASTVMAAAELGAEDVHIALRTPAKASPLVELAGRLGLRTTVGLLDEGVPAGRLVISTLPGGALTSPGAVLGLAPDALLLDVAYDPWPSALATAWTAAGGPVLSGLAMLVHQAMLQVRIFVNGDPVLPLDDEEAVLVAMLDAAGLDRAGRSR